MTGAGGEPDGKTRILPSSKVLVARKTGAVYIYVPKPVKAALRSHGVDIARDRVTVLWEDVENLGGGNARLTLRIVKQNN